jgi:hypothetical protein
MHNVLIGSSINKTCMSSVQSATAILQKFMARDLAIAQTLGCNSKFKKLNKTKLYFFFTGTYNSPQVHQAVSVKFCLRLHIF